MRNALFLWVVRSHRSSNVTSRVNKLCAPPRLVVTVPGRLSASKEPNLVTREIGGGGVSWVEQS